MNKREIVAFAAVVAIVAACAAIAYVLYKNCEALGGVMRPYAGCLDPRAVK